MCVTYYASYSNCKYTSFLGSQPCGVYGQAHPPHIFELEDTGEPCVVCQSRGGEPPIPHAEDHEDRHIITFPIPSNTSGDVEQTKESRELDHWEMGSLSDVDSITSHWRLDGVEEKKAEQKVSSSNRESTVVTTSPPVAMQPAGYVPPPVVAPHIQTTHGYLDGMPEYHHPAMQPFLYHPVGEGTGMPQATAYVNGQCQVQGGVYDAATYYNNHPYAVTYDPTAYNGPGKAYGQANSQAYAPAYAQPCRYVPGQEFVPKQPFRAAPGHFRGRSSAPGQRGGRGRY